MSAQLVELHFEEQVEFRFSAFHTMVQELLNEEVGLPEKDPPPGQFLLVHQNHPVQYLYSEVFPQTRLSFFHQPTEPQAYEQEIKQSWHTEQPAQLLQGCLGHCVVSEHLATNQFPIKRTRLFHATLHAACALIQPKALVFRHSQQVISPVEYLGAWEQVPIYRPGSLNVRFYQVSEDGQEMLMDTRGLDEIGLPDLQCHFRELEPKEVGKTLRNIAYYMFEHGPIIQSGDSVGSTSGERWTCRRETSLMKPARDLLDLNPGQPYAAGKR